MTSCLTFSYSVPMHVMRKYNAKPQRICIFFFITVRYIRQNIFDIFLTYTWHIFQWRRNIFLWQKVVYIAYIFYFHVGISCVRNFWNFFFSGILRWLNSNLGLKMFDFWKFEGVEEYKFCASLWIQLREFQGLKFFYLISGFYGARNSREKV